MKRFFIFSVLLFLKTSLLSAAPINFTTALQLITSKNIEIQKSQEFLQAAQDKHSQSFHTYFPSLSTQVKSQLSQQSHDQIMSVDLQSNLFQFGADRALNEQTEAAVQQATFNVSLAKIEHEQIAALALLSVVTLQHEMDIATRSLSSRRATLAATERLFSRGVRSSQDVTKVKVDTSTSEAQLITTQQRLFEAQIQLETLSGVSLSVETIWPWQERFKNLRNIPANPDSSQKLASLEARVRELDAATARAQALRWPSLDVSVGYSQKFSPSGDSEKNPPTGTTATLSLTIPIYDRLQTLTQEREQRHQRNIASLELEDSRRKFQAQGSSFRQLFLSSVASAIARESTLSSARDLFAFSLKSFEEGRMSTNDLSLDESRLYDAERLAVQGWATAHEFFVKWCRYLERGLNECMP